MLNVKEWVNRNFSCLNCFSRSSLVLLSLLSLYLKEDETCNAQLSICYKDTQNHNLTLLQFWIVPNNSNFELCFLKFFVHGHISMILSLACMSVIFFDIHVYNFFFVANYRVHPWAKRFPFAWSQSIASTPGHISLINMRSTFLSSQG